MPHEHYPGARLIKFRIAAYFHEHTDRNHSVHNHHPLDRDENRVDGVFAQLTHFFRSISLSHHRRVAPRTKPTMTPWIINSWTGSKSGKSGFSAFK